MKKKSMLVLGTLATMALGIANVDATCNSATVTTVTTDIAGEVICVLQHDTQPPAQIAIACVGLALTDIENILAADPSTTKWRSVDAGTARAP